jgi:exopolysaccharide production protein ExoQ
MSESLTEPARLVRASGVQARLATSSVHTILTGFLTIGLLLEIGAFRLQLAGMDPRTATDVESASLLMQVLMGLISLAAALLLCTRQSIEMALRAWPLFLMPALALASMLWSPEPAFTFRKSLTFLGTVLFGFLVATRLNVRDAVRLVGRVLSIAISFSVAWIFLFPEYGIHQVTDITEQVHTGSWRGIFPHRTELGNIAALSFGLLFFYGRLIWPAQVIRYPLIVLSILCVIEAHSGGGFVAAAMIPAVLLFTRLMIRMRDRGRAWLLTIVLVMIPPLILLSSELLAAILSLLEKHSDLTGRTQLWDALLVIAAEHPFLGFGYAAGFAYGVKLQVFVMTGALYAHCHNGYLEVLIAFGYVGLGICLIFLLWLLMAAGRLTVAPSSHLGDLGGFPLTIVLYAVGVNFIESLLISGTNVAVALLALSSGLVVRREIECQNRNRWAYPRLRPG